MLNKSVDEDGTRAGIYDKKLGFSLLGINICIVILNSLAVLAIMRFRSKNAIDIFILTLALMDLTKGIIPVPMSVAVYLSDWNFLTGKNDS